MEALYRKYRPSTFSDVIGQDHIERTLKNAIEQGKVSHAYLFCGPRGTGKTTMARILAKALLCEKGPTTEPDGTCPECQAIAQGTHPDVYELDAASRTGVDNVREEIIARVNYAPTRGAWKIYIIDEVHMLSVAAFNALLKTLEEPPEHVVFILCTTDPQKVPETIQSRCQRFDFHRISHEAIVSRLGAICVKEGADFEGEALDLIAYRADGGMRNALTSLEQLMAFGDGHVTLEGAQNLLGSLDETDLSDIMVAIGSRDAASCFNWVARYIETGADLAQFVQDLAEHVRNMYLLSMAGAEVEILVNEPTRKAMVDQLHYFGSDRLARMLTVLGDLSKELRTSSNPRLSFEIALTRLIKPESDLTVEALAERVEELERKLAALEQNGVPAAQGGVGASAQSAPAPQPAATQVASATTAASAPAVASPSAPARPAAPEPMVSQGAVQAPAQVTAAAQPAPQPAVQPAPAQPAAQPAPANVPTGVALIDLSNPAAIQRFWHTVTTSLRKANPARGVLFMNAKVSANAQGTELVISFSRDNGFAYTAAQKPEVQQLLAQTISQVAGGMVPYRLVLEGQGAAPAHAPAQATSQQSAPAAQPASAQLAQSVQPVQPAGQTPPFEPAQKAAAVAPSAPNANAGQVAAQAQRVRDAVAAAAKRAKSAEQSRAQAPQAAPAAPAAAPQPAQAVPAPAVSAPAPAPASAQTPASAPEPAVAPAPTATPAPATPSTPAPAASSTPAPAASYPDDDQVPLEAYGDAFFDEEQDGFAPAATSTAAATASASAPAGSNATTATAVDPAAGDEAAQIKKILSDSFGAGIKFEELPE